MSYISSGVGKILSISTWYLTRTDIIYIYIYTYSCIFVGTSIDYRTRIISNTKAAKHARLKQDV